MYRRTSNIGILTSREYAQKIVPLFSEVTRSKTLQAESVVLIQKNQSALVKLQLANDSLDCSSDSLTCEALPILISQEKSWIRSCENTDQCFIKSATTTNLEQLQFTGSMVADNCQKSSGGLTNCTSSTTFIHEKKLQPIHQEFKSMSTQSDSDDSDSPTPEETYAEYLRTHALPQDPQLPYLKNPPSASLLQGTAASIRRQSFTPNITKRPVTISPSSNLSQDTPSPQSRHASIPNPNLSSKQWTARNSSYTTSPTDAMFCRRRSSTGIATPSPLTSTSTSISPSPSKDPPPCSQKQSTKASIANNCSSDTSVESASSDFHLLLTRTVDRSNKLSQAINGRESRVKDYYKAPLNQGARRSRKGFALSALDRSEFWQKVLMIARAQSAFEFVVSQHRERITEVERKAARCITRLFLKRRATRFAILNFRREKVYDISRFFAKVIVAWRVRAATRRIEHFLVVGAVYRRPTMGFCASRVLRFLRSVRLIQQVIRCFLRAKKVLIASLECVWNACEGSHISHIFQMVQDKHRDNMAIPNVVAIKVYPRRCSVTPCTDHAAAVKLVPSSRRRNSAPDAAVKDCDIIYQHQQQQFAGYQERESREEGCGFRPKATFEEINSTRHSE